MAAPARRPARARPALALAAILSAGPSAALAPAARAGEMPTGVRARPARAVDGGTLVVAGARVRLAGMAAPDLDQTCQDGRERSYPCGWDAARALSERVAGATVVCEPAGPGAAGDMAVCRADGADLGAWMVGRGLAVPAGGDSPYAAQARRAWGRRLGLWAGVFQDPAERRARLTPAALGATAASPRPALEVGADQERAAAVEP